MQQYRVYLAGAHAVSATTEPLRSTRERAQIERSYRAYLPGPEWLPAAPVRVCLTGRDGKRLRTSRPVPDDYELCFLAGEPGTPSRVRRAVAVAAAAVAVMLPAGRPASAATAAPQLSAHPLPPGLRQRARGGFDATLGPPTSALVPAPRPAMHRLQPLRDARGRVVELGAFHNNTSHSNTAYPHSNTQTQIAHTNTAWSNHSNVPQYIIPHTNVVPGDFIF